jgi:hypothetical protein
MTHIRCWRVVVVAVLVATISALGLGARADAPVRQGWWKTSVMIGPIDIGALLDPSTADVPADGLLVAGGSSADAPRAYAALSFDLIGVETTGPLRLTVHPTGASVPDSGAVACPLDDPGFKPAQGGPIADAPAYDCLGAVDATIDDTGAYLFDVTTLRRDDAVAVAILPATSTARIVFAAPDDSALPTKAATTPPVPSGTISGGADPLPAPTRPAVIPADPTDPIAFDAPPATTPTTAGVAQPAPPALVATPVSANGSSARAYALLALAAVAGTCWWFAGRARLQPVPPEAPG